MSKFEFKINRDVNTLKEVGGSSGDYILNSGIYDVTLDYVSVVQNAYGATSLNFNVDYKGTKNTLYGLRLENNDGTPSFQRDIFNELCIIVGLEGSLNNPVEVTVRLGKNQEEQTLSVLEQFSGAKVKVRVQNEYSYYNDQITENRRILKFFREDGASAIEILKDKPKGKELEKAMKYATQNKYKDGLTEEDVEKWKGIENKDNNPQTTEQETSNPFE